MLPRRRGRAPRGVRQKTHAELRGALQAPPVRVLLTRMAVSTINWVQLVMVAAVAWGCGSSNDGTTRSGVNGGTGGTGAVACSATSPCGGAVDGTWQLVHLCTQGDLVAALNSQMGMPAGCSDAVKSATLGGSGTVMFADGTQTDNITQNIQGTMVFTPACVAAIAGITLTLSTSVCNMVAQELLSDSRFTSANCTFGGGNCDCSMTMAVVDTQSMSYVISGNTVTYPNGEADPVDYCVSGTTLFGSQALTDLQGVTLVMTLNKI
jgi:hypothetical protein